MSPDKNVEAVRAKLLERSQVGLAKYGVTTERTDTDLVGWLNHLQEELMDAAVYVQRSMFEIEAQEPVAEVVGKFLDQRALKTLSPLPAVGTKLFAAQVVSPDVAALKLTIEQKVDRICLLEGLLNSALDENHSLKTELEAARKDAEWQPIETAPKTGRTILLGYVNALGNWRTMRGQWFSRDLIDFDWEEPEDHDAGWYETSVEADDAPSCWKTEPTHWKPLPAPPAIEQAKGGA